MKEGNLFPPFQNYMCDNCHNRRNPQFVFNSIFLTVSIITLSFMASFAANAYFTELFTQKTPKCQELQAKFNYMIIIFSFAIVIGFLLMYNLNGTKF